jgi:hypothetical protein
LDPPVRGQVRYPDMSRAHPDRVVVTHRSLPWWLGAVMLVAVLGMDGYAGFRVFGPRTTTVSLVVFGLACVAQVLVILAFVSPTRLVFDLGGGTLDIVQPRVPWYLPLRRRRFDLQDVRDVTILKANGRAGLALVLDGQERPVLVGFMTNMPGAYGETMKQIRQALARRSDLRT